MVSTNTPPRAPTQTTRREFAGAVTLITGDRVTLLPAGAGRAVDIEPGPGRAQVGFVTVRDGDEVTVIPRDVAPLVAGDRVDRALFNITRLIAGGYGDRDRADLPLIVTGLADAALAARAAPGALTIDRVIPALGVTALRQAKSSPGAALALVEPATARAAVTGAGAPRIWLDRRLAPTLDRSVPQIGGPAAWARGVTGQGVVVAVLDTGIDAGHPDLAGKVVAAENFVDDGLGTSDVVGHATHVASIIAGSGAASGGQFRGVAPDAQLLSGRVCGVDFCSVSATLAGMVWAAVDRHAPIVNLSLGGQDQGGDDPLKDAVNQLSAQYGTLFVIAAGNAGQGGEQTIATPGAAEAALTVGAVDRDDQLAVFSSRGPLLHSHAIKPDITAPGVGIVAALATTVPPIGAPVGTAYQALSGTSMATPHVAGAAAILLQQHPGWTGAELKAALISQAAPNPALTAFEQGAGRVDLDRATRQRVIAEPASISLGVVPWPHTDDPIQTRSVTYHNDGPTPITLALTANLALADHRAAPAGMIRVAPAALTVPAGGSADAVVTIDTNGDAADGLYTGAVVASAGDTRVTTLIGVEREIELHELTLRALGSDGEPGTAFGAVYPRRLDIGLGSPVPLLFMVPEVTLRLPRDGYEIYTTHLLEPVMMVYPNLSLDHDTTVVFDARDARPVDVSVPGVALPVGTAVAGAVDSVNQIAVSSSFVGPLATAQLGPDLPPDAGFWGFVAFTATPDGADPASAERYTFAHQEPGHMVTGWREIVPREQLATIHASYRSDAHSSIARDVIPFLEGGDIESGLLHSVRTPRAVHSIDHVFGNTRWRQLLRQNEPGLQGLLVPAATSTALRDYRPGQHYVEQWNHAPFGPALAELYVSAPGNERSPASRLGDTLTIAPSLYSDQALPARMASALGSFARQTLLRDGEKLVELFHRFQVFPLGPFSPVQVPSGAATYRYEEEHTRGPNPAGGPDMFDLSTSVRAAWTFRSQHVAGAIPAILPLPTVRFLPELDDDNRATRRAIILPVAIERPVGAATPRIAQVSVEVSFDDGATWSSVPGVLLGDRWYGLVVHPPGAAYASLRGAVRDVDGNAGEATIIHAYRLPAQP